MSPHEADLDVCVGEWLVDVSAELAPETVETYIRYFANQFAPRFNSLVSITEAAMKRFRRDRLKEVSRSTVGKELSAMRGFLAWCKDEGYLSEVPEIKDPPKRATGTVACEKVRVDVDHGRAVKVIAALPKSSKRRGYPVQDFVFFIWETGLRRRTVRTLRRPEHYTPGSKILIIEEKFDKARFGREVALSDMARELLDRHCEDEGLIWGSFDCRGALRKAARDAGCFSEREIQHLSLHDFRHGALTEMAEHSPNLAGIAHLAGHKRVTTTTRYVHSNRHQGRAVLDARPRVSVPISVAEKVPDELKLPTELLTSGNHRPSEDGGIGRRAGFRFQCP